MKRIDTMSIAALRALMATVKLAESTNEAVYFSCIVSGLECHSCPFNAPDVSCVYHPDNDKRTADQWREWANEPVSASGGKEGGEAV